MYVYLVYGSDYDEYSILGVHLDYNAAKEKLEKVTSFLVNKKFLETLEPNHTTIHSVSGDYPEDFDWASIHTFHNYGMERFEISPIEVLKFHKEYLNDKS
jgi:hypothetical protein